MKNFGTVIDNFDAVTKQYVDNKVPTDEHIKGIKVDNATLADTAKKVKNAFTYKAHNKAAGTVVPITYDGSEAASLDFNADDFAYDYSSGKDIKVKLVDKGYATSVKVNGNTIESSGGVVDIGTVLTDASKFATSAQGTKADTAIQTVTLESGTNNGTVKITVNGTATDNVAVKGLKSAAYTESSAYATAAQGTKADNAMPKAGGAFTGAVTVQAPTAEMNPATKQYVDTAINAVKQFEYQVVTELPTAAQATMGKIYLVAHSHNPSDGKPDSYDEFITVQSGSTYKWERIGNTDIDLSEYVPTTRKINNKALSSDITLYPTDVGVTEANFPGLNKTGTVTGVNMNGATKTPSSGVVDLGTVLTDESKFATAAQGSNADSALAKANANATEISNIKNGTNGTKVKFAEHADTADSATSAGTANKVAQVLFIGAATSNNPTMTKWSSFNGSSVLQVGFEKGEFLGEESVHNGDEYTIYNRYIKLSPTGVTAGKYNNVTVDEKGRVTEGSNKDYATTAQVNAKYTKPESGIPKSDLAEDVKTSLGKADTALQSAPVTSVNGKTDAVQLGASDVGALPTSTKYVVSVNGESGEVKNIAKTNSANTFTGDQTVTGNGSVSGNLTVGGNLTVNGTTTTVDSTTLQVKDKLIEVAHGNTTTLTTPAGLVAPKYDGTNSGALVFDSTGTAYVGDVTLDSAGNIDVSKSQLQPLATRTGLVGGNLVQYDSTAQTLKDSGKKISDLALTSQLPTVNNGTLTIQKNGTNVATFGANQSTNTTANITVPVKVSELTNDSGFTTNKGTITGINMNGASKGTSGVVDLGTVLTDASKFATAAQGTKADNALPLDGGTIKKSKTIKMDASANSDGANLKWGTVNSKNPYIGYASDQVDGTFVVGSLLGTNYASGLAIGGGSGNLLWKGTKVATTSDIPNIVQSTGTSTSSVMSQNATTNAISGKLDKTTYEVNKTIEFGRDGALYVGKFKVYDTNVTCEVTSTTDVTYSGKLVIATQNYVIKQMTVYGDAANTVTPNFYIKPSTTSDPYIEVYFKPASWSKNVVHIYGCRIEAEPTDVCTNVPSVPATATLKPKNALPIFELSGTTLTITL